MAKAETTKRVPRGAGPVSKAFFTALESIPEATRAAVAKAAQAMIRDQIKMQREKAKAAAVKEKARAPLAAKSVAKKTKAKPKAAEAVEAVPVKRRTRKPAEVPATA